MANQHSMDLRKRAAVAVEIGALSCHQAAAQFGIGVSTRRLSGGCACVRPAALRWPDGRHKPGPFRVSTLIGCGNARRQRTLPCVDLSPNSPGAASRSMIGRSETAPRSQALKNVGPANAIASTLRTTGVQWRKYQDCIEPKRLVFIDEIRPGPSSWTISAVTMPKPCATSFASLAPSHRLASRSSTRPNPRQS